MNPVPPQDLSLQRRCGQSLCHRGSIAVVRHLTLEMVAKTHEFESNRPTGYDSLQPPVFLFNFFKVFSGTFNVSLLQQLQHLLLAIRPKVRTAMDSMDSEEAEFLEPEQDEAKFAHDDAVCIYIYSLNQKYLLCNKDVF